MGKNIFDALKKAAEVLTNRNKEKTFEVTVNFSGYVRGVKVVKVTAKNKKEAIELVKYGGGEEISKDIIRDDTEKDELSLDDVTLIKG